MKVETILAISTLTLIGLTVLVAVFQAREMARQSRRLAESNHAIVYQHCVGLMIEIDRYFVDSPELRPYFYGNRRLPTRGVERERALALAEWFADFADDFMVQRQSIPNRWIDVWSAYFADIIETSPALRTYWRAARHWYASDLNPIFDPACANHADADNVGGRRRRATATARPNAGSRRVGP